MKKIEVFGNISMALFMCENAIVLLFDILLQLLTNPEELLMGVCCFQ